MKCVREEEIKKGFGRYLQMAVAEPVCIESTHQPRNRNAKQKRISLQERLLSFSLLTTYCSIVSSE
jgi:hypothetical protein